MDMIKHSDNPLAGLLLGLINTAIQGEEYKDDLFTSVPVEDLLFHGFSTGVLRYLHDKYPQLGVESTTSLSENGTVSAFTIDTGKIDATKYALIELFNGEPELPKEYWKSCGPTPSANQSGMFGICHDIFGTDGSQQKSKMHADQIWTFNDELCRSFPMDFTGNLKILGLPAARYEMSESVLDSQLKENLCYCPYIEDCAFADSEGDSWNVTRCSEVCKTGTLNLRGCKNNKPIIVSKPHFLHGDPSLGSGIQGMLPNPSKHQSYIDLNPATGVSLAGHFKIQINVPLEQNSKLDILQNVSNLIFPVIWFDICADIDKKTARKLRSVLITPVTILNAGIGCAIAVGVIVMAVGVTRTYQNWTRKNYIK